MKKYDIAVLGAGPGGYVSAIRAAQLGAKTAIIEKKRVGGTCLNVGCVPTKALMKNVEILHALDLGKQRGIQAENVTLDFKKAIKAKDKAVRQLTGGVEGLLASNGVDFYAGMGTAKENREIQVRMEDGLETIAYDKLIIATGSAPSLPPIPGIQTPGIVTSDTLLNETRIPEKLVIIGGGVIGCELASIFRAYGSKVTIVEMMPDLVSNLDQSISESMMGIITGQGIEVKVHQRVVRFEQAVDSEIKVFLEGPDKTAEMLTGSKVLISTGRKPMTSGLEDLELETEKGFIQINDHLETSRKGVYAIGDVTGKRQLAHVASEMGIWAAENAMGAGNKLDLDIVPSCIYTIPEVGSVGLSEAEAKEKGYEAAIGTFPLMACGKAVATGEADGMSKIIADKRTRRILGAHLIGKSATEIIAEMAAYMKMGATIEDITQTIHAHPTISESIAEAARAVDGWCVHMPKI